MIFVTAGHVNHGKTSLLQALTGMNTAHLPEEKKRGLTIDLGYAYLAIEDEMAKVERLGFIDVPGHQKFMSNMLAGLGGIQHALLVVSAEEGIKPQTEEHIEILRLLKFEQIAVIVTKSDRANMSQMLALIAQLRTRYPFLHTSPCFYTSTVTGAGIDELKQYLINCATQNSQTAKPFRYAIDRIFNIKGAGLVVTGTAIAGQVKVGDELYLSNGESVRVKAIHAQNCIAERGSAGQRLALNLANVEKEQLQRGNWLSALDPKFATDRISIQLTASTDLRENQVVHLYHFASHTMGKLNLLDAKQAVRNEQRLAEIILDQPLHIAFNDKLMIRSGDDRQTLAGARVLEINAPKRYKRTTERLIYLNQLANTHECAERIALYSQSKAVAVDRLLWLEQLCLSDLAEMGFDTDKKWIVSDVYKTRVQQAIVTKLTDYHQQHNDQLGVAKARLYRMAALAEPEQLVLALIDELIETKQLAQTRGWVHLPDHRIEFSAQELHVWQQIKPLFEAKREALWVRDVANTLLIDETVMRDLLYKAGKLGYLMPIVKDRFFLHEHIVEFAQIIKQFIANHGAISVNQLRDQLGFGRKMTVQLIEYFDRCGFLRRKSNLHLLRDADIFSSSTH
ncbi:selenocysteine-specific translation elongation factor [[Haemophilus] ducreyi]|uniref:Selenocysteine-specific elongation factor n=1 Tax=Haemophilus ducreyi (strain 35000HP / ATCC 700724) TaxID=233412 RepID=Q7VKC3_HAEDU|nr:selenocysteine-specific translation elongation factor [[Haemophilus] ducreyi]AAP96709.1 selenocysteine-specific elongation factor [[Haemophilus] ducreyi 35000HP]AKO37337.1 translation elongation factor [[Haemophilus] ducreyi]AKO38803.1 translation elongation factor [[Haemophilus] ducreyi]AKO40340.1 translation elongation factor [[Haemophilus] ducreyi]AKO41826.1 translation elongation factor [[Haemophilus] ducreyi]